MTTTRPTRPTCPTPLESTLSFEAADFVSPTPAETAPRPQIAARSATHATHAARGARAVLATLADLFLPLRCAGCGGTDEGPTGPALCVCCAGAFDGPFDVHRPLTATGPPVHALAPYRDTARTVVLSFKERGRRDLAVPLGRMMAAVLPTLDGARPAADGTWWLVPAPSRGRAARSRGGSHTLAVARVMAAALAGRGEPAAVAPALRLAAGTRDSAGLRAADRIANLTGRVLLRSSGAPPPGTPAVLLDDVVTTGATAAACVRELAAAGVEVTAVLALTAV
jgi:predicted amidophosphoribosyltransferase